MRSIAHGVGRNFKFVVMANMRQHYGIDKVSPRQKRIYIIIFEAETSEGKRFDVILLWVILFSVVVVLLESVNFIREGNELIFIIIEWIITILFTVEYAVRIYCVGRPLKYIFSFYGIIDLLAILPTFIGIFFPVAHPLMVIRMMRLLRVFRILNLKGFIRESQNLTRALRHSGIKILVFLFAVLITVVVFGTIMFMIEPAEAGFTSIPQSIYWAIVTLTTIGYGDIVPVTPFGRALAAIVMILGYGLIAVPTGIVSSQMAQIKDPVKGPGYKMFRCSECGAEGHLHDARYCRQCGQPFEGNSEV